MNIVIAGAGDVGFHLAQLLAEEDQDITLIDQDEEVLTYAAEHLDVRTIQGDCSSHHILERAEVHKSQLFIAVSTQHSTNILACIIARKMGAKKTIARTNSSEYLKKETCEHFKDLGVDELFSPQVSAVEEIMRLLQRVTATDFYDFENGKISMLGFTINSESPMVGRQFSALNDEANDFHVKVICVLRDDQTIIVSPNETIQSGDHIYLAADSTGLNIVNRYIGKSLKRVNKVMIIGDTELALNLAIALEKNRDVKVIMKSEKRCKDFVDNLNDALILKGDPNNFELLKEEGLEYMDAFIALTPNSETNILSCLFVEKEYRSAKTIALVNNVAYTHISQSIGVDTIINNKILAAHEIFRHVRRGNVEAIASFHGVDGEIIEFMVNKNNGLIKNSISNIDLPSDAVIAGVVRNNVGIIPKSDFVLRLGDHVIIYALPGVVKNLEKIFN